MCPRLVEPYIGSILMFIHDLSKIYYDVVIRVRREKNVQLGVGSLHLLSVGQRK